jgi:hypothetical protein
MGGRELCSCRVPGVHIIAARGLPLKTKHNSTAPHVMFISLSPSPSRRVSCFWKHVPISIEARAEHICPNHRLASTAPQVAGTWSTSRVRSTCTVHSARPRCIWGIAEGWHGSISHSISAFPIANIAFCSFFISPPRLLATPLLPSPYILHNGSHEADSAEIHRR